MSTNLPAKDIQLAPYDWKKTALAGLRRAGLALGALAVAALYQLSQDPVALKYVLEHGRVPLALVPTVIGLVSTWANWQKNKERDSPK